MSQLVLELQASSCCPAGSRNGKHSSLVNVTGIVVMVYSCEQYLSSLGQSSRKLISSCRVAFSLTLTNGIDMWSLPFGIVSSYLSICCLAWDTGHLKKKTLGSGLSLMTG